MQRCLSIAFYNFAMDMLTNATADFVGLKIFFTVELKQVFFLDKTEHFSQVPGTFCIFTSDRSHAGLSTLLNSKKKK